MWVDLWVGELVCLPGRLGWHVGVGVPVRTCCGDLATEERAGLLATLLLLLPLLALDPLVPLVPLWVRVYI